MHLALHNNLPSSRESKSARTLSLNFSHGSGLFSYALRKIMTKCSAANSGLTCRETTRQAIGEIHFPTRPKLFKQVICGSFFMHQQPKKLILRHIIFDSWVVLTCICHNDCIYMPIMYLPVTESIGCIIKYFKLNIDHCPVAVLFYV